MSRSVIPALAITCIIAAPLEARYCNNPYCSMCNRLFGPMTQQRNMQTYSPVITRANLSRNVYYSPKELIKLESTPEKTQDEILSSLNLTKDMVFCDLGCGDASFLIKVHKKFKCRCLGIEKDDHRFEKAWENIAKNNLLFDNVVVLSGDVLDFDLSGIDVFYMYQFPPVIASFLPKIPPNSLIISYAHEIPGRKQWKVEKNGVTFYVITPDIKQTTSED